MATQNAGFVGACPGFSATAGKDFRPSGLRRQRRGIGAPRRTPVRAMFLWQAGGTSDDSWGEDDGSNSFSSDGENNTGGSDDAEKHGENRADGDEHSTSSSGAKARARTEPAENPLYEAIRKFDPENLTIMQESVSDDAKEAMRRTLTGVLGALPAGVFDVQVSSERDGLRTLLFSSLMTGYSLRNAEFRMTLSEAFSGSPTASRTEDASNSSNEEPDYMKQVPSKTKVTREDIAGKVSWWDSEHQMKREMEADTYVSKLEAEVELLRDKLQASDSHSSQNNKVLNYMRTLSLEKVANLQQGISGRALDAMKKVVSHMLGVLPNLTYSISRDYLSQLTYWCLMVGYNIRDLEKRQEILQTFNTSETLSAKKIGEHD